MCWCDRTHPPAFFVFLLSLLLLLYHLCNTPSLKLVSSLRCGSDGTTTVAQQVCGDQYLLPMRVLTCAMGAIGVCVGVCSSVDLSVCWQPTYQLSFLYNLSGCWLLLLPYHVVCTTLRLKLLSSLPCAATVQQTNNSFVWTNLIRVLALRVRGVCAMIRKEMACATTSLYTTAVLLKRKQYLDAEDAYYYFLKVIQQPMPNASSNISFDCVAFLLGIFMLSPAPVGLCSRSRLRDTQAACLYPTAEVWVAGGFRGTCSGRSKSRIWQIDMRLLSAELGPRKTMENPHVSCFAVLTAFSPRCGSHGTTAVAHEFSMGDYC